jgi:hypothetical protein
MQSVEAFAKKAESSRRNDSKRKRPAILTSGFADSVGAPAVA